MIRRFTLTVIWTFIIWYLIGIAWCYTKTGQFDPGSGMVFVLWPIVAVMLFEQGSIFKNILLIGGLSILYVLTPIGLYRLIRRLKKNQPIKKPA
jgi:hypothetical protein